MYESFISRRYLKAKRKQSFINLITLISIGGVALGVASLIIIISVMAGFRENLQGKLLGAYSHLVVETDNPYFADYRKAMETVAGTDGVVAVTPYIQGQIMLSSDGGVSGAMLRGIDPETAGSVLNIKKDLKIGTMSELATGRDGVSGIILGRDLARILRVTYGDDIIMLSPTGGDVTPMGIIPRMKRFVVVGIFEAGMFEYDSSFAYVSIADAQAFMNLPDAVSGLEVKLADIYQAREIGDKIQAELGSPFAAKTWMELNKDLFAALELEKVAMFIILVMIVFVAAFNIASTLIMLVMEKAKDIAILKAMGATKGGIMKIFMFEGTIIGALGTVLGGIFGWGACFLLARYEFIKLDPNVYYISSLPVKMVPGDILIIIASSVVLCLLATIYPSFQASRMDPVEALRYE